jgi:hypothetical protein
MVPQTPREDSPNSGGPRPRSRGRRRSGQGKPSVASSRLPQRVSRVAAAQSVDGQQDKPSEHAGAPLDERKAQQLKQEQATFEQAQFQDKCFFVLRVAMGVIAILAIPAVITICSLIIFDPHQDVGIKRVAESALFLSLIGLVGYVWRVFVRPASVSRLKAVTSAEEDLPTPADQESADQAARLNTKPRKQSKDTNSKERADERDLG